MALSLLFEGRPAEACANDDMFSQRTNQQPTISRAFHLLWSVAVPDCAWLQLNRADPPLSLHVSS